MGSRLLGRWLNQPLLDLPKLQARQEAVQALIEGADTREVVRGVLKGLPDIERLTNRTLQGIAGPRDLIGLRQALTVVPALRDAFEDETVAAPFRSLLPKLQSCEDVVSLIERAIADDARNTLGSGDAIKTGYNDMLDPLRTRTGAARSVMANLEERERTRSNIPSLKVGYNKIFGYYIEISNAHKDKVPSDYIRRQTLVNCERYITAEMKESESLILGATDTLGSCALNRGPLVGTRSTGMELGDKSGAVRHDQGSAHSYHSSWEARSLAGSSCPPWPLGSGTVSARNLDK